MAKTHPPYAPEFRRRMVELVRAGRTPDVRRLQSRAEARMACFSSVEGWSNPHRLSGAPRAAADIKPPNRPPERGKPTLPRSQIAMQACAGARYRGREIGKLGHT